MKLVKKMLIPSVVALTMASATLPLASCNSKSEIVKPDPQRRESWFRACDKIDTRNANVNFSHIQESWDLGKRHTHGAFRIVNDLIQTWGPNDGFGSFLQYNKNLKVWFNFSTMGWNWSVSNDSQLAIYTLPDFFKNYFDQHQEQFDWSRISENILKINILPGSHEADKCITVEFFDDTKLFKTITVDDIYGEFQRIYKFYHYDMTQTDPNFIWTNYWNTKSIDTTSERKYSIYDKHFDGNRVPSKFKLSLDSSIGKLCLWNITDTQNFRIIKADGRVVQVPDQCVEYDRLAAVDEITVINKDSHDQPILAPGDRFFFSVSFDHGIKADNISLKYEEIQ